MIQTIRTYLQKNKLLTFLLCYGAFYLFSFFWLENREVQYHMVSSEWDRLIPFCEYFIFLCKDQGESMRFVASFCTAMTVFLLVSYFYPNGHELRPEMEGDGVFIAAVRLLHRIDTSTNILPSMHVFVTVANSIALLRQQELRKRRGFVPCVWAGSILIILSTLFLKQHSIIDVVLALLLNVVCYVLFYKCSLYGRRCNNRYEVVRR